MHRTRANMFHTPVGGDSMEYPLTQRSARFAVAPRWAVTTPLRAPRPCDNALTISIITDNATRMDRNSIV
jgi:hypothetical protein